MKCKHTPARRKNMNEIEFTEEQEAVIQARILEDRKREHKAIAGDRFYRLAIAAVIQSVQAGMDDEEVLRIGQAEWKRFQEENPIAGKMKKPELKKAGKE